MRRCSVCRPTSICFTCWFKGGDYTDENLSLTSIYFIHVVIEFLLSYFAFTLPRILPERGFVASSIKFNSGKIFKTVFHKKVLCFLLNRKNSVKAKWFNSSSPLFFRVIQFYQIILYLWLILYFYDTSLRHPNHHMSFLQNLYIMYKHKDIWQRIKMKWHIVSSLT